jgi:alpha-1,6-mannosyltransferase
MSFAMDFLIFGVAAVHVALAPFTKVEESFNLHAMHDIFTYGVTPGGLPKVRCLSYGSSWTKVDQYDHFVFSGVVPRSFIGSLFIAGSVWPLTAFSNILSGDKFQLQIIRQWPIETKARVF